LTSYTHICRKLKLWWER